MDRRTALKCMGAAAVVGPAAAVTRETTTAASNENLSIKLAGYPYDHTAAFFKGSVEIEGYEYTIEKAAIGDMNTDALGGPMIREVTEIGMSPYMLAHANEGLRNHTLIPVFPLRVFRHKSVFIRPDRGINTPEDLKGKKIATPGYSSSSLTWIRGFLLHEYGVSHEDVEWVIATKDSSKNVAGTASKQERVVPEGLKVSQGPEGMDESDLLVNGEVDALFHAAEPKAFAQGNPNCVRLFRDSRAVEQAYYKKTGIFPIMHAIAIRNDVIEANPWLPKAVFDAYSEAKQQNYDHMRKLGWALMTLPWISQELEDTRAVMGDNFYSYGMTENNRKTLNALFQYSYEQGLASRVLTIEELFHPSTLELIE